MRSSSPLLHLITTMWLLVLVCVLLIVHIFRKLFKIPKLSNLVFVTGGVKTGKSTMSVYFAIKQYKRNLFAWKLKRFFSFIVRKWKDVEKPLLYSNVPLGCDYVPLTMELVMRQKRFTYGSVVYIQEASLFADSMMYKDEEVNTALKYFVKLIAHETKGGALFFDSQSPSDVHYSIKRSLQSYFYIHHSIKIPFFMVCYVRELLYSSEEQGINNLFSDDVEECGLRRVIIPKRIWRKFDCYTYSALTDDKEAVTDVIEGGKLTSLKTKDVITIQKK